MLNEVRESHRGVKRFPGYGQGISAPGLRWASRIEPLDSVHW